MKSLHLVASIFIAMGSITAMGQGWLITDLPDTGSSVMSKALMGYDFVPNTQITIDALGVHDYHSDGMAATSQIGLWDQATHTLLASATIDSGTANPLDAGYRWASISPLTLNSGVTYTVASWNDYLWDMGVAASPLYTTYSVNPSITLGWGHYEGTATSLHMPTINDATGFVFIGPGVHIVPEPSSLALFGLGVVLAGFCVRRKLP